MRVSCAYVSLLTIWIAGFFQLDVYAQDHYAAYRKDWLEQAAANKPVLTERVLTPLSLGRLNNDNRAFQGWKVDATESSDSLFSKGFKAQSGVIVDFGEHVTGYVSFALAAFGASPDAPLRLKFTFGEVPAELAVPFDPYKGSLSRAWLQDEIVTISEIPGTITIPRRLAFRYVKIELITPSIAYDFKLTDLRVRATTSATAEIAPLAAGTSSLMQDIDRIGLLTLKECMQTVFEDGPKRDRRLWIGDLYLEALANNYSFKNQLLTKRCLYLLAGLSNKEGYLYGTVFETPEPHPQEGKYLLDYALLYNVCLKDYYENTADKKTALDLWPVAKKQLDLVKRYLTDSGMLDFDRASKEMWVFIDWKDGLHREAAIQGLALYALKQTYALAKLLDKETDVAEIPAIIKKMTKSAKDRLFDKSRGLFISGANEQVSYASQIWMILGEVVGQKQGADIIRTLLKHPEALKPGGPYLYHYFLQAMIHSGMTEEAKEVLLDYWGGMVQRGADTFWEVYDPVDEYRSPYNFYPINSYCHAWSCTPVYFIRKYPEIFQR